MATRSKTTKIVRRKNAASQAEVNEFVRSLEESTLYATPINRSTSGVKAWARGEVFQAVNPPRWTGSPFFRNSDAERIYGFGYRKIIVMDGAGRGFDVDLVMQ